MSSPGDAAPIAIWRLDSMPAWSQPGSLALA